jgi:copper homeostasis protein
MLQVIATSAEDCIVAETHGADSIELCVALELGGLTPSIGLMRSAKAATNLPINAMVRPRTGGAVYSDTEFTVMLRDAEALVNAGCDGLVVGCITGDGQVDQVRCWQLRSKFPYVHLTFHRAFDLIQDAAQGLAELMAVEFNALLTSGRKASALDGAAEIRALVEQAEGQIVIIAGGGVTATNARTIAKTTGCSALHGSFSKYVADPSLAPLPGYRFGSGAESIRMLDGDAVAAAHSAIGDTWESL